MILTKIGTILEYNIFEKGEYMTKNIKWLNGDLLINQIQLGVDADEEIMEKKIRECIIEALSGGKYVQVYGEKHSPFTGEIVNISDWSQFGKTGDKIIIEDILK